mgnify:CR=1 FL=1
MANISVLVVDDHVIIREGLKALLELEKDVGVVYEAASGMECLEMLDQFCPDVVLMDLKMPGIGGIDVIRLIKQNHPQIKVILLTNYDDEEYVLEAIKAETDGYVLKDVKKGDLARIIRLVLEGHAFVDPSVTQKVFHHLKKPGVSESFSRAKLSQRELQILECLVEGKSNQEIADAVFLSIETVKSHLKKIYQKLSVIKRSQAVTTAIKENLIHLPR